MTLAARTRILHSQPLNTQFTSLPFGTAVGQSVALKMDDYSDAIYYFKGAAHNGFQFTFEQSPDSTNGTDGTWFALPAEQISTAGANAPSTNTNTLLVNGSLVWHVTAPGAAWVRARCTAAISGTLDVAAVPTSVTLVKHLTASINGNPSVSVSGSGTSSIAKAEDAVHASGDLGVYVLGVRAPTTPAIPTSAAGDYGSILVDQEGKLIVSGTGGPETTWDAIVDLTATTDAAIAAAPAAGIRRYVTDITLSNTGAAAVTVNIKDGATRKFARIVPANSSVDVSLKTPIRLTAATALNGALSVAGTVTVFAAGYLGV